MSKNPFAAPMATPSRNDGTAESLPAESGSVWKEVKTIFFAWEKLRFLYNLILIAVVILIAAVMGGSEIFSDPGFWVMSVLGAIASNGCFFLGPIVESYIQWLGLRLTWLRVTCFMAGLTLTSLAAIAAVTLRVWN